MKKNKYLIILGLVLVVNCILIFNFLHPVIAGDGVTYQNSMQFLMTGQKTADFQANHLLTTFGGMEVVIFLSKIFGSLTFAWIFMYIVFYFLLNFFFYKIIFEIHKDEKTALI